MLITFDKVDNDNKGYQILVRISEEEIFESNAIYREGNAEKISQDLKTLTNSDGDICSNYIDGETTIYIRAVGGTYGGIIYLA
jgi:hypothetical protein